MNRHTQLDVYIHRSGVIELRVQNMPLDKNEFVEKIPTMTTWELMSDPSPKAPAIKQRRWLRQRPEMHGVFVWIEA